MARHALTTTALDSAPTRTLVDCDVPDVMHPGFPCQHITGRDEPAHRVAGFYSNRTEQFFPYRDVAPAEGETFCELTIRAIGMISNSFGWLPNRAWHVMSEAYRENDRIDYEAGGRNHGPYDDDADVIILSFN